MHAKVSPWILWYWVVLKAITHKLFYVFLINVFNNVYRARIELLVFDYVAYYTIKCFGLSSFRYPVRRASIAF